MTLYQHITTHCIPADMDSLLARLQPTLARLRNGTLAPALLNAMCRKEDIADIKTLAADIGTQATQVVVVGAGASILAGQALAGLRCHTLQFLDNIDPDMVESCVNRLDMAKTHFIVISKSGATVETLAQFLVLWEKARKTLGKDAARHFTVLTLPQRNPLRDIAAAEGMRILDHADIGGRFSILTHVGLLPAALAGLDVAALRHGAQLVLDHLSADSAPMVGAALQYAWVQKGCTINVMMPYATRLYGFTRWYRQGWAESLAKGGKGSTPIDAMGTTDQHSQLQLYLDGPKDKLFHLITVKRAHTGQTIHVPDHPDLAYMQGKTTGDIMEAEQHATLQTLVQSGRPVRVFALEKLAEEELGALLMHCMLEIIFASELFGVNPFDQPAVEAGKKLARDYLRSSV